MATRTATRTRKKPTEWTKCSEGIEYKRLGTGETSYQVRWIEGGGRTGPR